jgi:hypothetical protein
MYGAGTVLAGLNNLAIFFVASDGLDDSRVTLLFHENARGKESTAEGRSWTAAK